MGAPASRITGRLVSRRSAGRERFAARSPDATFSIGMGVLRGQHRAVLSPAAGGAFDARPSVNDLPDVQSELFEQVTDDELALLAYYRALRPDQRAALLEALVRMVEPARQAANRRHAGRARTRRRRRVGLVRPDRLL